MSGILQIQSNAWAIPALTFLNYVRSLLYAPDTVHEYTGIHIAFQGVVRMDLGNKSAT